MLDRAATGSERASALIRIGEPYDSEENTLVARSEFKKALALTGITSEQSGQTLLLIANGYSRERKWQPANVALEKLLATEDVSNPTKIRAYLATQE